MPSGWEVVSADQRSVTLKLGEEQRKLYEAKKRDLVVRSPIDGVVVTLAPAWDTSGTAGAQIRGALVALGDVRGDGYFFAIELVKDKVTKETFNDAESEKLLRGILSYRLFEEGLYCRSDDRGDPVVQLAPPLTIGRDEFVEIEQILRSCLDEAWRRL